VISPDSEDCPLKVSESRDFTWDEGNNRGGVYFV
jgi:hypothetical protein